MADSPDGGSSGPTDRPVLVSPVHGDGLEYPGRAPGTGDTSRAAPVINHRVQITVYDDRDSYRWSCSCGDGGVGSSGGFLAAELRSDAHLGT